MTRRAKRPSKAPRPRFSQVKASPPHLRELLARVRRIPQKPRPLQSVKHWGFAFQAIADYLTLTPEWLARQRGRFLAYPTPFRKIHFSSWDGTRLTAWLGVHTGTRASGGRHPLPREGIIVVPGMFSAKDNTSHRARALRLFKEWGYHVLVLDLRGMGESSRVFNTAGWKESEDIEAAIDHFRAHVPLTKVHVYGESLGGVGAILAAAHSASRGFRLVDGAILAVSPFLDARRMLRHLGHEHNSDAFNFAQWAFARLLHLGGRNYLTFEDYLRDAARSYGVSLVELYRRSTVGPALAKVNVPLLILSADDDPILPEGDLDRCARLLRRRPNPVLLRLPWGSHCLFEQVDPEWFWTLLHEFFDFYCVLPTRPGPSR